jgi:tetratricopeptide (TPR) repeat protein
MRVAAAVAVLALAPFLTAFDLLQSRNREIEQGNAAMQAGKTEEALKHYDAAVARLPADAGAHFDRGAALYALSRFDEAGQEFLRATEAKDGALKASAFYNLGNAFFKKEKYKEAIEAYKRTLALDPHDQRAKWNLEVATVKQREEEKKQKDKNKDPNKQDKNDKNDKNQQSQKDQNKDKDKDEKKDKDKNEKKDQQADKDKKDQPQKQPPPEKADAKEIEAVLDSLERSPKDLEKERARLRAIRRAPPARDW